MRFLLHTKDKKMMATLDLSSQMKKRVNIVVQLGVGLQLHGLILPYLVGELNSI